MICFHIDRTSVLSIHLSPFTFHFDHYCTIQTLLLLSLLRSTTVRKKRDELCVIKSKSESVLLIDDDFEWIVHSFISSYLNKEEDEEDEDR